VDNIVAVGNYCDYCNQSIVGLCLEAGGTYPLYLLLMGSMDESHVLMGPDLSEIAVTFRAWVWYCSRTPWTILLKWVFLTELRLSREYWFHVTVLYLYC